MTSYAYAVCLGDLDVAPAVDALEVSLRLVREGPLSAVVGDAPAGRIRPSRENLLRHESVLRLLYQAGEALLPMRFGHVFPDDEGLRASLLRPHAPRLTSLLRRVEAHVELHVQLEYDQDDLLARSLEGDAREELIAVLAGSSTMQARIRVGERVAEAVNRVCRADAALTLEALEGYASATVVHGACSHDAPLRAALLVPTERLEDFDAAAEALARALPEGASLRVLRPLVPYSFAALEGP